MTPAEQQTQQEELRYGLYLNYKNLLNLTQVRDDYRLQLESYKNFAGDFCGNISPKDGVRLTFDYFDSNILNGLAFKRNTQNLEFRFATVSAGAILYFHEFFSYLMSRVDILPLIGLVTSERNLPYHFQPPKEFPSTQALVKQGLLRNLNPLDPFRLDFAQIMAITTSKFLILHEIGHCTNGHVGHSQFSLEEFGKN